MAIAKTAIVGLNMDLLNSLMPYPLHMQIGVKAITHSRPLSIRQSTTEVRTSQPMSQSLGQYKGMAPAIVRGPFSKRLRSKACGQATVLCAEPHPFPHGSLGEGVEVVALDSLGLYPPRGEDVCPAQHIVIAVDFRPQEVFQIAEQSAAL